MSGFNHQPELFQTHNQTSTPEPPQGKAHGLVRNDEPLSVTKHQARYSLVIFSHFTEPTYTPGLNDLMTWGTIPPTLSPYTPSHPGIPSASLARSFNGIGRVPPRLIFIEISYPLLTDPPHFPVTGVADSSMVPRYGSVNRGRHVHSPHKSPHKPAEPWVCVTSTAAYHVAEPCMLFRT